jgi:hypothetical protein
MKYIADFVKLKELTENYWDNVDLNKKIYGFQIQKGTKWKKGLSEDQINEFEKTMGFKFPEILRDYYTVMNGVDKEQINVFGNSGYKYSYSQNIFSFPDEIQIIKDLIMWIYEENKINENEIKNKNISRIFPICYHRFILIDHEEHPILSMHGNDIIFWANNIIDLYKMKIGISEIKNVNNVKINFWLDC